MAGLLLLEDDDDDDEATTPLVVVGTGATAVLVVIVCAWERESVYAGGVVVVMVALLDVTMTRSRGRSLLFHSQSARPLVVGPSSLLIGGAARRRTTAEPRVSTLTLRPAVRARGPWKKTRGASASHATPRRRIGTRARIDIVDR